MNKDVKKIVRGILRVRTYQTSKIKIFGVKKLTAYRIIAVLCGHNRKI